MFFNIFPCAFFYYTKIFTKNDSLCEAAIHENSKPAFFHVINIANS
jgi:hypothetical protein